MRTLEAERHLFQGQTELHSLPRSTPTSRFTATTATIALCQPPNDYVRFLSQSQPTTVLSRARFFPRTTFGSVTLSVFQTSAADNLEDDNAPTSTDDSRHRTSLKMSSKQKSGRSAIQDVVAREYTIHMHKRVRFTKTDQRKYGGNWVSFDSSGSWMLTGWFWNSCTVSCSRRGLPAPSRRSRRLRTGLWYADPSLTIPKRELCPLRPRKIDNKSKNVERPDGSRMAARTDY
ncbi:hypothetical protein FJTKL_13775 [Diaporthe vaccinii]|uniref:Uncharacterized protein n=1 Tax=Diaporthe vaccinii TaxID=105482 RepID=A0ABR4F8R3_9PEZI